MWVTADACVGLPGLPTMVHNIRNKLSKNSEIHPEWRRKKAGSKAFEYHIDCLPPETRAYLIDQQVRRLRSSSVVSAIESTSDELWLNYQEASEKKRQQAALKYQICCVVDDFMTKNGMSLDAALKAAAEQTGKPAGTLRRWFYINPALRRHDKRDWLALLCDTQGAHAKLRCKMSPEAWSMFQGDYLRTDGPSLTSCYERLKQVAMVSGWEIPGSERTFRNMVKERIPLELRVRMREGDFKAKQTLIPAQRRTRAALHALSHVNGDGYTHNVFVLLPNGKVIRPTTWFFQDVYSSMLLSYCVDVSENTDMLALALHSMVSKYGIPEAFTFDRGSPALSQAISGRISRPSAADRKHKKFDSSEIEGAIRALGVTDITWTRVESDTAGNKGNARAKPIERAFHGRSGLGDVVDKDPAFHGATVGDSVDKKPAHYANAQKSAVPLAEFLAVLERCVDAWNNREGRRTEMARAERLSYRQVFERSYSQAQIKKASEQQLLLCLMRTEECKVNEGGLIELKAGQTPMGERNRYHSALLYPHIGTKVSLRFDPFNLHSGVYAYSAKGSLIGLIPILEDVGFNDQRGARLQRLTQEEVMARTELMQEAAQMMAPAEVAEKLREAAEKRKENEGSNAAATVSPGLIRMMPELPTSPEQYEFKRAAGCDTAPDYSPLIEEGFASDLIELFGNKE